jgi:predicted enzyme related to lactoylglutathione lyase
MFQGLRTVIYNVNDLEKAKAWYTKILGIEPYFSEVFYVGYNVGGFELGLVPNEADAVTTYWGVADIKKAIAELIEDGAVIKDNINDVGGNILVASVLDPFGNVVGVIQNPHFSIK